MGVTSVDEQRAETVAAGRGRVSACLSGGKAGLRAACATIGASVDRSVRRTAEFVRHPRTMIRRNVEQLPFDYPPSVIIAIDTAVLAMAVAAAVQRHSYFPTALPVLAVVLTNIFAPLYVYFGVYPRPWSLGAVAMASQVLFLVQPVPADFAPFVLIATAGEVAAIAPKRVSIPVAVAMMAELAIFDAFGKLSEGMLVYPVGIALGWMAGLMLQYQRRLLHQERDYQRMRAAQAAAEERRRIAREVHDVIAHSLSVTLLHLTGARHALETDRDVDDAVLALTDAERLGRQAMADIRRTVGLLGDRPGRLLPEPGVSELPDLVGDFVRAGLPVHYVGVDAEDSVSPAVGLALYRIGQESLANVVKHAPGATAEVTLRIDPSSVRLTVRNTLPHGSAHPVGSGMGMLGMRQRAELLGGRLSAGRDTDGWTVGVCIPLAPPPGQHLTSSVAQSDSSTRESM